MEISDVTAAVHPAHWTVACHKEILALYSTDDRVVVVDTDQGLHEIWQVNGRPRSRPSWDSAPRDQPVQKVD